MAATTYLRAPNGNILAIRPPTVPDAPTGLSAVAIDTTTIRVSWTASTGATSYELQASNDGSTGWAMIATQAGVTYDHAAGLGVTRYYRVRAINSVGNSGWAGPVSATTAAGSTFRSLHAAGQTFLYRPELNPGTATNRYSLYRSASQITSLSGLTPIQKFLAYNGGQVFGGKPDISGGQSFTQTNRLSASSYVKLPDGTSLSASTALAVHTCTSTGSAYYALVATDTSGTPVESIVAGVNSLASPVSETAIATTYPTPTLWADSASRSGDASHAYSITGTTSLPVLLTLHASSASGGAPANNTLGDYWTMFGDSSMGYQEGMQTAWDVLEIHSTSPHILWASTRDTMWTSDWLGAFETWHDGAAYADPAWSGAVRFKAWQHPRLQAFVAWIVSHYSANPNRITIRGQSMGAWGAPLFAYRYPSLFAMIQATFINFRTYTRPSYTWPVVANGLPFGVGTGTSPLGTNPALVMMDDGTTAWGGTGGFADTVTLITNATTDLPMLVATLGRQDGYSAFQQFIDGVAALQSAHQPHAVYWTNGGHDATAVGMENLLSEWTSPTAKAWATYSATGFMFRRDVSYPAFTSASHDENPSTDTVGGRNIGFTWTTPVESGSAWSSTIDNTYMDVATASGGPKHGPFSSITVDITPVFRQSFLPTAGTTVNYSYTPNGGSLVTGNVVVPAGGRFTIPGVVINAAGPTPLSLSA